MAKAPTPAAGPLPTFAIRHTRMGGALLHACREGEMIRVRVPVQTWANDNLARERATMPASAATDGLLLAPAAPVRVRYYHPSWWDLNATGSTVWDEVMEVATTADGPLQGSRQADIATGVNMALTGLEALPFAAPGLARMMGVAQEKVVETDLRGLRAGMVGMSEAAPMVARARSSSRSSRSSVSPREHRCRSFPVGSTYMRETVARRSIGPVDSSKARLVLKVGTTRFKAVRAQGRIFYVADQVTDAHEVAAIAERIVIENPGAQILVLSGQHGSRMGLRSSERQFFREDRLLQAEIGPIIRIIDVSGAGDQALAQALQELGDHVIAAWCFSEYSRALRTQMGENWPVLVVAGAGGAGLWAALNKLISDHLPPPAPELRR